ncbi:MAG: S1C family serine protease [Phycisphaerae bacterium]
MKPWVISSWAVAVCVLAEAAASGLGHAPNIAPNTTAAAVARAAPAVVKLYGGGISRTHGYGTGVIVSPDGRIVTTLSLLTGSSNVRVVLSDGRTFDDTRLVRSDRYRQLALLKIEAADLPFLKPGDSDHVRVGDAVIALGNWYKVAEGDEPMSVTRGILSLKTNLNARRLAQPFDYAGPVLVCDAITSNPGAPGGVLIDLEGRFIGLIGRVVEAVNTNTRLNYALPAEQVAAFLGGEDAPTTQDTPLRMAAADPRGSASGERPAPWLGLKLSKLGYRHVSAYVARVRPGAPAAKAGVRADDLILGIGGRRIPDATAYREAVARLTPGQVVQMIIKRGDRVLPLHVTVGEKP